MAVTMSRDIAARLYDAIRALRPAWHDPDDERGAMKVVVTGGMDDDEPLRSHVRTKAARKRLAERFKNPEDELRLVIVCDMWLTGFDCPPAHTMYLDKPLATHNLMQAIARVNRVYGEKPGGLIVDLLGLADRLADALAIYTQAGGMGEAVNQVQDEAVPAMEAAFEKLGAFFPRLRLRAGVAGRAGASTACVPEDNRPGVRPGRRLEAPADPGQGVVGGVRACGAAPGDGTDRPTSRVLSADSGDDPQTIGGRR